MCLGKGPGFGAEGPQGQIGGREALPAQESCGHIGFTSGQVALT